MPREHVHGNRMAKLFDDPQPIDTDILVDHLRLIRSHRVGPATYRRLMGEHGSASAALQALPEVARAAGAKRYTMCSEEAALDEIKAAHKLGARALVLGQADYPHWLAQTSDAPPVMWALGDTGLLTSKMVGMVGARNASSLGTRMAGNLARDLAEAGVTTVSGLARGIDTAAHLAALPRTIAVMAGGLDCIYPTENAGLAQRIAQDGLLLSEQPPGQHPIARHFPARNRIIAGLSRAVIVVEAAAKSGSLITATNAAEAGREVMAVPGHPMDPRATGTNNLLRDGAILVRRARDVLDALGDDEPAIGAAEPSPDPVETGDSSNGTDAQILSCLGSSPVSEDWVIRDTGQPPARISARLTALELQGRVARLPGGMIALAG